MGEVGTFGYILIGKVLKIGIFIIDEELIMNVLEDFMLNWEELREQFRLKFLDEHNL